MRLWIKRRHIGQELDVSAIFCWSFVISLMKKGTVTYSCMETSNPKIIANRFFDDAGVVKGIINLQTPASVFRATN